MNFDAEECFQLFLKEWLSHKEFSGQWKVMRKEQVEAALRSAWKDGAISSATHILDVKFINGGK